MTGRESGEDLLVRTIRSSADRIYAVPGYPVSTLVSKTGARLVINEKVALELAIGDSLAGRRACVIVKHVGMNALVDPLVHATFQGLSAGVVIVCGDDPAARNTMTVQDSRFFGPVASIPVFEGIHESCIDDAFTASERHSRVSLLRLTAEDLGSPSIVQDSVYGTGSPDPSRSPGSLADSDLTMYGRAVRAAAESARITAEGLSPIPLSEFHLTSSPTSRRERGSTLGLCAACPFRSLFDLMAKKSLSAICDTGCSLIAMNPPYSFGVASYGMGSAVAVAASAGKVALIGDYALLHSGLQGLIEVYQEGLSLLCIVMVNQCMGMTGGQPASDPLPYLIFAEPQVCDASDLKLLEQLLTIPDRPRTVLVYGRCPEVINHETMAC
ncbi:MAG: thiamine pyrophosphate-dependent enzyme [Methanospirillum sp.]|uniref:thiamine pyrophosphate-dependent enzyme n=1 Tax=Methanospirillum sp. TaxID=45200 RepID=UPI00236D7E65|nr:thiamine pyrophosphate-dependent enzyme [Methanospirillum sp.]MDD1728071.1 thiamine pyrophosphate-dependent enzyme [Methanospirillum sp.]